METCRRKDVHSPVQDQVVFAETTVTPVETIHDSGKTWLGVTGRVRGLV